MIENTIVYKKELTISLTSHHFSTIMIYQKTITHLTYERYILIEFKF